MRQGKVMAHARHIELFPNEALVELLGVLEQLLAELLHTLGFELRALGYLGEEAIHRVSRRAQARLGSVLFLLGPIPLSHGLTLSTPRPHRLPDTHRRTHH